jgi:hypothetical protein
MSQPRTKSSIVHDSPPSRRTILPVSPWIHSEPAATVRRIRLEVSVEEDGLAAVEFSGMFVALK